MSQLHEWARLLGGEVSGLQVNCPGPGHSATDRSLSVKMSATNGGFVAHSHASDDWQACRDYVAGRLGMEPFKPKGHSKGRRARHPPFDPEPYDPAPRLEPMTPEQEIAERDRQMEEAIEIRVAQRLAEVRAKEPFFNGQEAKDAPQKPKMTIEWFGEAADSALIEPANPLIENLLDEGALSVIYGDSGSGKTFVALDTGFHVGAGLDWNGKKVKRGLVVYVAAEGGRRIKRRIGALQKRYREEYVDVAPDPLFALVRYQIDLRSSDADLNSLLDLVRDAEKKTSEKCVWLIVDTLSRAMAGGDENSPVDMGRIVAAADRFRAMTSAHFTYVHHTGKDSARGARGHSLLRAATDTEIETTAESLTITKQRDGELGFKIGFKLVDLIIGEDPSGLCVKSAVVEWGIGAPSKAKPARESVPRAQRLLMAVVDQAIDEAGFSFAPFADGPIVRGVKDEIARARYYGRIAEPDETEDLEKAGNRKRQAFNRAVKAALDAKELMAVLRDGERLLWKP